MAENVLPNDHIAAPVTDSKRPLLTRIVLWGGVGAVVLFLLLGLVNAFETQPTDGKAPDFTLETYGGDTIHLADLEGQVVVLNFWASWCGPCALEAPDLEAIWQDYKDRGVMMIGVGYVDSKPKAEEFMARYGMTYPNGADLRSEISDAYAIRGVPETFVINQNGEVVFFIEQVVSYEQLATVLEETLAGGR
jgi:cytochrome c biogenesis protein CcmG/thiol:disulfide interchange protein DsbE